jgi:hypothetical protein
MQPPAGGARVRFGVAAAVCGAYAAFYIAMTGPVLDMGVESAQVIAGVVRYPSGHPYDVYHRHVYSLLNYVTAGVLAISNATIATVFRNWLFLFSSVYAAFALGAVLTRGDKWGYAAAAVTASGTMLQFSGRYPMSVFPTINSDGHLGLEAALIAAAFLVARWQRTAGWLLGLLPAVHGALAALTWPWALACLWWNGTWRSPTSRRALLSGLVPGCAISAVLAGAIAIQRIPAPFATAPHADAELVRRQFTALTDHHRAQIDPTSLAYLLGPLTLALLSIALLRQIGDTLERRAIRWFVMLAVAGWVVVYAAAAGLAWRGWLPGPVESLMPFRFSNVGVSMIVPFAIAAIASASSAHGGARRLVLGGLAVVAVFANAVALLAWPSTIASGPIAFALVGFAFGALTDLESAAPIAWAGLAAIGVTLLVTPPAELRLTRAVALAIGAALATLGARVLSRRWRWDWLARPAPLLIGCLCAAVAPFRTDPRWRAPASVVRPGESALTSWLDAHTTRDELILAPISTKVEIQLKTGHPVLFETETLYLMQYMPSLSAEIGQLTRDLYDVDYTSTGAIPHQPNGRLDTDNPLWERTWPGRTRSEWQTLASRYGFRLVFSKVELTLPIAVRTPLGVLYRIPPP